MIPRLLGPAISRALTQFPIVVLTGARQVGKTTLARWLRPDAIYITLDDPAQAAIARLTPDAFFAALAGPVVLDEAQYAPEIFRHLKIRVDRDRQPGGFLITGSQTFSLMAGVSESLAGRVAVFMLPTLSIGELTISAAPAETDRFLWRRGFPELWQRPDLDRDLWMGSYVATYLERDVRQVVAVGDLREFDRFLRAAAVRAGQLLSYAELARDAGIAPNTAKRWMSVLETSQQVFLLEPYHRQRTKRLIKAPKLYFCDTGLLCHLLRFRSSADLPAHGLWGHVWENFVVSEVRKRVLDAGRRPAMWFWRTASGNEVDLLVELGPERFVAIECRVSERVTSDSLKGIRRLAEEYGSHAVQKVRIVCRTTTAYPVEGMREARAVPVAGPDGIIEELAHLGAC